MALYIYIGGAIAMGIFIILMERSGNKLASERERGGVILAFGALWPLVAVIILFMATIRILGWIATSPKEKEKDKKPKEPVWSPQTIATAMQDTQKALGEAQAAEESAMIHSMAAQVNAEIALQAIATNEVSPEIQGEILTNGFEETWARGAQSPQVLPPEPEPEPEKPQIRDRWKEVI